MTTMEVTVNDTVHTTDIEQRLHDLLKPETIDERCALSWLDDECLDDDPVLPRALVAMIERLDARYRGMFLEMTKRAEAVLGEMRDVSARIDDLEARPVGHHVTVKYATADCAQCGRETQHESVNVYDEDGNLTAFVDVCDEDVHHRVGGV
jgi:hypothetical protein